EGEQAVARLRLPPRTGGRIPGAAPDPEADRSRTAEPRRGLRSGALERQPLARDQGGHRVAPRREVERGAERRLDAKPQRIGSGEQQTRLGAWNMRRRDPAHPETQFFLDPRSTR